MAFAGSFDKEFHGPDAGFSAELLDHLQKADWFTVTRGRVTDPMLPLAVAANAYAATVTVPKVLFPINSLPLIVSGLQPNWSIDLLRVG